MKCLTIKRKLSAYQDGELNDADMLDIRNHLMICDECSNAYHELTEVWDMLQEVDRFDTAPFFWTRLSQHINERKGFWNRLFNIPKEYIPASLWAAIILIVGLTLGMFLGNNIYEISSVPHNSNLDQEIDVGKVLSLNTFDELPNESFGNIYVSLISQNPQLNGDDNE